MNKLLLTIFTALVASAMAFSASAQDIKGDAKQKRLTLSNLLANPQGALALNFSANADMRLGVSLSALGLPALMAVRRKRPVLIRMMMFSAQQKWEPRLRFLRLA